MENKFSRKYFQLTMCFNSFDPEMVWSENFHFKPFLDSCAERERERERESPILRPSSSPTTTAAHSSDQAPIRWSILSIAAPRRSSKDWLQHHSISPLPLYLASRSNPVASLSSFFSQFDRIWWIFFSRFCFFCVSVLTGFDEFFSEFCFFCISVLTGFDEFFSWVLFILCFCIEEWYYIFVWQLRKCEKMWAISRKCVFYGIFKNTTKYQKIFFKTFFEMQPNTRKYFPFPKITFSKNIYLKKNILHEPNTTFITTFVLLLRRERLDQAIVTCLSSLYILLGFRCFMSTLINTSK